MQRYQALCKRFYDIAEVAFDSETASHKLLSDLNPIGRNLGVCTSTTLMLVNDDGSDMHAHPHCSQEVGPSSKIDGLIVHNPIAVKRKGRPRTKRMQSTIEKITKKKKSHVTKTKHTRNDNVSNRRSCHLLLCSINTYHFFSFNP
ncbi:hypothetical protein V8G54_000479 [Vigna mungo]|uniref:Uncharacterized protein n=1 Tax=Vigna mungo TaxID=3915 RepID=A0AAQ3P5T9_VIGMU